MKNLLRSIRDSHKWLFLFALGTSASGFGQNVTENKVNINYIQLPTNVISKQYTFYEVAVNRPYELANEDSLAVYQSRMESASAVYEAEMIAWRQNVNTLKRNYLGQMANWEKKTNAGTPSSPPQEPVYPPQPIMQEVEMPQMHSDLTDMEVDNAINFQGFSKGAGGVVLTVEVYPISNMRIVETKKGSASTTKYNYVCNYTMPLGIKVEVPGQGTVLQTIVSNGQRSYTMKTFDSKYEHELWMLDNKDQFWMDLEKAARNSALGTLNETVNDKCGFPVKKRLAEVYTVKKFKDHSYSDLTTAFTIASQGYKRIAESRDRNAAKPKLLEAIAAWKEILKESNPSDKKSRINDKVTALIQCNIAEAYIWLSEFDEAEIYINLAKNSGVSKFKRKATALESLLKERRLRWNSYFG